MRKEFSQQVKLAMAQDSSINVLLGDIGVGSFLDGDELLPNVYNLGINEQSMVSFGSGISDTGKIVLIHTIAPFLVERAYEQIKLACGYNEIKLIFVSANGPFDYHKLGPTHHCPADIPILSQIPNLKLFAPGNVEELGFSLKSALEMSSSSYIRLTNKVSEARTVSKSEFNQLLYPRSYSARSSASQKAIIAIGESQKYVEDRQLYENYDIYSPKYISQNYELSVFNQYKELLILEPYSSSVLGIENNHKIKVIRRNFGAALSKTIVTNQGWERFDDLFTKQAVNNQ
ncbi:hypothetical protein N9V38_02115 [Planktomarina temperata]|nr:hypothetical protein [Planktomarina temperata]